MTCRINGWLFAVFCKGEMWDCGRGDIGEGTNFEMIKKNEQGRKREGIGRNGARRTLFCVN